MMNVISFIPVGMLLGSIWGWKGAWFAAGLSCVIELLQLITARGLCEFDDVIHNMIGVAVGVGLMMAGRRMANRRKVEKDMVK